MSVTLSTIASQQITPIEDMLKMKTKLLNYAASHLDAVLTFKASEIILAGHSDASYLSESQARSRAGGHFICQTNQVPP